MLPAGFQLILMFLCYDNGGKRIRVPLSDYTYPVFSISLFLIDFSFADCSCMLRSFFIPVTNPRL